MSAEYVLMIPHLSKELNLFGFSSLPYILANTGETKSKNKNSQNTPNIVFNSKLMIEALINVCLELIKLVKALGADDTYVDKINFENNKLKKQLKQCELEIKKKINALNAAEKLNEHLQENITVLQNKIKNYETKLKSLEKKGQTDKDVLQHALKKKESDLIESYKMLRKRCYTVYQSNFQKNSEMAQLNQSDFHKLWSMVKYSNPKTREEALKEAVWIFQKNNRALIEEEFSLKTLLLHILQEIHETFKLMVDKMHIPESVLPSFKSEMIWSTQGLNVSEYNNILHKHLKVFKEIFKLFDKASFVVSDDLFVCLSHIINNFNRHEVNIFK